MQSSEHLLLKYLHAAHLVDLLLIDDIDDRWIFSDSARDLIFNLYSYIVYRLQMINLQFTRNKDVTVQLSNYKMDINY